MLGGFQGVPTLRFTRRLLAVFLVPAFAGLLVASSETDTTRLEVGLIPERNVFEQVARYEPLTDYLSNELGRRFELTMLSRYGNMIERLTRRETQLAFLGSFTGALANAQLAMLPVARPVNSDGTSTYYGRIFVRRDSGVATVADMKGLRLALVERATTAGYVFPLAYLRSNGVTDLENHFSEVRFWGSHDAAVMAVLEGRADVGAGKNTVMDWLAARDPRVVEQLVVLASSPRVPSNALFVSSLIDDALTARIRDVVLDLHKTPEGRDILIRLGASRFVTTRTKDYAPVLELAEKAAIDLDSYGYINP